MGTQNPRFFPLMGTVPSTKYCWAPGSCPSIKILSKSVGHGSLGVKYVIRLNASVHCAFGNIYFNQAEKCKLDDDGNDFYCGKKAASMFSK